MEDFFLLVGRRAIWPQWTGKIRNWAVKFMYWRQSEMLDGYILRPCLQLPKRNVSSFMTTMALNFTALKTTDK